MSDPFGEPPTQLSQRLKGLHRGSPKHAPKRQLAIAGAIGPFYAWLYPGHHNLPEYAVFSALTAIPPLLVEGYWKRRHRREREQLSAPARAERAFAQRPALGRGADR